MVRRSKQAPRGSALAPWSIAIAPRAYIEGSEVLCVPTKSRGLRAILKTTHVFRWASSLTHARDKLRAEVVDINETFQHAPPSVNQTRLCD